MKVHWTNSAVEQLIAVYEYIARDSRQYALRTVDRITRRSIQIGEYPGSGRVVPEYESPDVRELIEPPFRIIYRIGRDRVDILAVIHGAQRLPPSP